jgi:hypothetical protein
MWDGIQSRGRPFANFGRCVSKLPLINLPQEWTSAELPYVNNSGLFDTHP